MNNVNSKYNQIYLTSFLNIYYADANIFLSLCALVMAKFEGKKGAKKIVIDCHDWYNSMEKWFQNALFTCKNVLQS